MTTTHRPAPGPARDYRFPRFHRFSLTNGLRVIVAPVAKLPIVTILAVVDAGAAADPAREEGVASLTARAFAEGTGATDGAALTDRFERLGTALDAHADWDSAVASVTVLTGRLPEAVALMAEVLTTPIFPEREVERLKGERIAELLQLRAEPRGLADELFSRFAYDARSRYAEPEGGSAASVSSLDRARVAAFHRARYTPGATTLVLAGDVTVATAEALVTRALGAWAGHAPAAAHIDDRPATSSRAVHLVSKEDAPQSELRLGHVGVPRSHPDYFDIVVMNAVLGGLFSSRINLNLREAHGYTYGAFSGFDWRRQAGPFVVSTAVKSDVTHEAAREILLEIGRMRATTIAADELTLATSYLDGVFPIRYETTSAIAVALAGLVVHGLPDDYYDRYRSRIRAVTVEGVLEAARRYLHPGRLQLVVVGDPATVRAGLEALRAGPVRVYDTEGAPLD